MPTLDFKAWPDQKQEDRKPFDRLMPFHRIRVPSKQIILPVGPTPSNPNAGVRPKVISGDAYSRGARSTKDYDPKFGEDLGADLFDIVQNVFPPLQVARLIAQGISKALGALINLIPDADAKRLAAKLDKLDPLVDLIKFIGGNVDALLIDSFIRSFPAWVPTFDEKLHPDFQLLEVDGILIRSHQRIDSVPFWQWHRWYDWQFALCPSPLFSELVGFGNTCRDDDNTLGEPQGSTLVNYHKEGLPAGATISANAIADCEWDIGALGLRQSSSPGSRGVEDRFPIFFDELKPRKPHDWCWPMAGMFFWASGRSVYDCTHATKNNGRRTKTADRKAEGSQFSDDERRQRGVHLNQLHPLNALATARWEAFQFKENPKPVPAIQFMFYANNHLSSAGFFDKDQPNRPRFPPLNDQDYQFIIDLPTPVVSRKAEYPIGHTPEFALNTLILQPRLLIDANFEPFQKDGAGGLSSGVMEDPDDRDKNELTTATGPKPIVELFGARPNEPPRQALVRIPLKKNISEDVNSYGVLLSIGWFDPDALQVKEVKKVTVKLVSIKAALPESDMDWNLNIGVNGRWFNFRFNANTPGNVPIQLENVAGAPVTVEMLLAEEDFVMVSVHGYEEDPFDDFIRLPPEFRKPPGRPSKTPPQLPSPTEILDDPKKIGKFKADLFARFGVLNDRLLRHAEKAKVPTGTPDPKTGVTPTTTITVPMVGQEIEWDKDIDTDDDSQASLAARATFLRLAIGNRFDANDLLGLLDPNVPDPAHKNPPATRSQDITDTPNPLVVGDILKEVGSGGTKKCQVSAYKSEVVGRMGTIAYDPNKLEYTFLYEVKVEDVPGPAK